MKVSMIVLWVPALSSRILTPIHTPRIRLGYIKICTFLCLITQLSALASAALTGFGIKMKGSQRVASTRLATSTTIVTLLCDIALLIIYPTEFKNEIGRSNRDHWELNGAFGMACGVAILALGSLILLLVALQQTTATIYESAPTRIWELLMCNTTTARHPR